MKEKRRIFSWNNDRVDRWMTHGKGFDGFNKVWCFRGRGNLLDAGGV